VNCVTGNKRLVVIIDVFVMTKVVVVDVVLLILLLTTKYLNHLSAIAYGLNR